LHFLQKTIFCALRHKKLPVGKKNMTLSELLLSQKPPNGGRIYLSASLTKAPPGLSKVNFSACERAKLARTI
jgi:hypothetical protein